MLEIEEKIVFKLGEHAILRTVSGVNPIYIMLDCKTGRQFNLSSLEYDILLLLREGVSFASLKQSLLKEYNQEPANIIENDLKEYLDALFTEGLAEIS